MHAPTRQVTLWALALAAPSIAAPHRPRFEPTDLELAPPGVLELDLQSGATYDARGRLRRLIANDFELNLGLAPNVEFDLDGAFAWNRGIGSDGDWVGDALWPSMKLGLYDDRRLGPGEALAFGLQLGPRLPTLHTGKGIGYAALALAGWTRRRAALVLNAGYLLDPGPELGSGRPSAFLLGLDLTQVLDQKRRWSLLGELGAVAYFSAEPNEYNASLGAAWNPSDKLQLSLVALGGRLSNGERLGFLFGIAPQLAIW